MNSGGWNRACNVFIGMWALALLPYITDASAQGVAVSTADNGSEQPTQQLGEITVTARKREESLLDVPVVVTPISEAQLQQRGTEDLKDIAKLVPGLVLGQTLGASGTQVSLRGVGTAAQNAGIDASVSLNLDGMQLTQGIAYASAVFDLAQVEVLKGPQALFFGKNSPGGVISLHTADPTDKFELIASDGYEFDARENLAQLIVSGPVAPSLKLRLAAQYDEQQGYFENEAVATPGLGGLNPSSDRLPGDQSFVVRGTALWEPLDQFDARLKVNMTGDRLTGVPSLELLSCPDGTTPVAPRKIPFLVGAACQKGNVINNVNLDPKVFKGLLNNSGVSYNDTEQRFGTLELHYRPRTDVTLTSVTGIYHVSMTQQQTTGASDAGPGLVSILEPLTRQDVTEELRGNTDFAFPVNATAGLFYQNGNILNRVLLPGNTALGLPAALGHYEEYLNIESKSAFAQLRWKLLQALELDAGARYTREARDLLAENFVAGAFKPVPTAVPRITSSNTSPEVTLSFRPTDDMNAFASYKQGFKSGSFSLTALGAADPNLSFGDEKVEGQEVGLKMQMLDRTLYSELALYDYHYKGLQVGVSAQPQNGVPVSETLNAGGALIYGVDYDLTYVPKQVRGLTLQGAVEWNHARFQTLNGVPCWGGQTVAEGCNQIRNPVTGLYTGQNLAGQPLLRAPDWEATFGFQYEFPMARNLTVQIASTNQYSSRYAANLGLRADFSQPAFMKNDVSLAVRGPDNRWEVALIGKNLGDILTTANCANSNEANGDVLGGEVTGSTGRGAAGTDELQCFMDRGREVWLRLTVRPFN